MKKRVLPPLLMAAGKMGFGRDGALVAVRRLYPHAARTPLRRVMSLLTGSSLIGVGVSLFLRADLGVPPFDVLISSLTRLTPLQHGQASWLVSGSLLVVASILGRRPSIWGMAYVIANGIAVDTTRGLVRAPDGLMLQGAFVLAGTVAIAAGISLVVHSGTTGGSFELLMAAGEDRGLNPARVRLGLEVAVIVFGVLLGGSLGPATLFFALAIAPLLRLIGQALSDHERGRVNRIHATEPRREPVPVSV